MIISTLSKILLGTTAAFAAATTISAIHDRKTNDESKAEETEDDSDDNSDAE